MGKVIKRGALFCFVAFMGKGYPVEVGLKAISTKRAASRFSLRDIAPDSTNYFSEVAMPSLSDGADRKDMNGVTEENSLYTWTQVSFRWKLNDKYQAMFNPRFVINHNPDPETETYEWDDPVFGINGTWYKNGKFSFGGNLDTILPIARTAETIDDGLLFNIGGWNTINYQATSKFSFGAWVSPRFNVYDRAMTEEDSALDLMFAPRVVYAINDKFSVSSFYQTNSVGDNKQSIRMDEDDSFNLSASYTLNDKLTVEPILTLYRENEFNANDANVTLWVSGAVF